MQPAGDFNPVPVLERFGTANVDFVVIGGVAAGVYASGYTTVDLDIAYARDRENLERIVKVLRSIGAVLRGAPADVPFQLDALSLEDGGNFTFTTSHGSVDLLAYPAGAPPYEELRKQATVIDVRGHEIRVASLDHMIAMKEAAGRGRDKALAAELRAISDELRAPRSDRG